MKNRYLRQELLATIGPQGQQKIKRARVLVVGCGALGSAQTLLLSRAGFGFLRIVDDDKVELGNLHRQILFSEQDARQGRLKAQRAAEYLRRGNSDIEIEALDQRFDTNTAGALLNGIDLVMDATDNFSSRFLINRLCVASNRPWIYGGAVGHQGMMLPIRPAEGPCLRCLLPSQPAHSPTAADVGVLNSLTATIAAMQVQAALRHVIGDPLPADQLLRWDAWDLNLQKIQVAKAPDCPCCASKNRHSPQLA